MKAHVHRISGIIHTWHAEYSQHLQEHLDTNSVSFTAFTMLGYAPPKVYIAQGLVFKSPVQSSFWTLIR